MRVVWRLLGSRHVSRNFIFLAKASRPIVLLLCVSCKELEQIRVGGNPLDSIDWYYVRISAQWPAIMTAAFFPGFSCSLGIKGSMAMFTSVRHLSLS